MPQVIVGVDAGGTKTAVAHRVDGGAPRVAVGEGASATALGPERAAALISTLIEKSLDGARPHAIFVGIAGGGRPGVAAAIRDAIQSRFESARIAVRDDAAIALRAVVPEGDGVVLVAGTGSIAYAERDGEGFRCGGYGYLIGDEGSGFEIGALGLKHLLRVYDGRAAKDRLAERMEEIFEVSGAYEVLSRVYGAELPVTHIARAGTVVLEAASAGERSAVKIVQGAALELSELAKAVIRKAGLQGTAAPIAFAGGLLGANSMLSYLLETRLLNECPSMAVKKTGAPPYEGALTLAERLLQ
jgi:glucosamine kinase